MFPLPLCPLSVLRPHPELPRPLRDVLLLRSVSRPVHAALPLVEEAHHSVAAGRFRSSNTVSYYKSYYKMGCKNNDDVRNLLRGLSVCILIFCEVVCDCLEMIISFRLKRGLDFHWWQLYPLVPSHEMCCLAVCKPNSTI